MFSAGAITFFLVAATAALASAMVLLLINFVPKKLHSRQSVNALPNRLPASNIVFLFEDETLLDATPAAGALLGQRTGGGQDLHRLLDLLAPNFPDLKQQLSKVPNVGRLLLTAKDERGSIEAERWNDRVRLTLSEPHSGGDGSLSPSENEPLAMAAARRELDALRTIGEDAPVLIWKQDMSGDITWANRTYLSLVALMHPQDPDSPAAWPPSQLFNIANIEDHEPTSHRFDLTLPDHNKKQWFEVTSMLRGTEVIHFGIEISAVVEADRVRKAFVQTMTKTFAQLSVGLAIFDRQRRLMIFNPAFLDLTGLPISFLSATPQLRSVLDRMRDRHMMPAPKNFAGWREQTAALEAQAVEGKYCETWTQPGGETLRVTGRPHPDGSIAFLFEDISDEVTMTRRYRAELDLVQATIDRLEEAIAVFLPSGTLAISNAAYDNEWSRKSSGMEEVMLEAELQRWQRLVAPSPLWDKLRASQRNAAGRKEWRGQLQLLDGRSASLRVVPMAGGALMVALRHATSMHRGKPLTSAEQRVQEVLRSGT
ncbi:MAG: PAS-domain containing protein [Rhodobacteraceae bacterium]|nr:PAS-domain containing protein [Paracoccaceae bacterium]